MEFFKSSISLFSFLILDCFPDKVYTVFFFDFGVQNAIVLPLRVIPVLSIVTNTSGYVHEHQR